MRARRLVLPEESRGSDRLCSSEQPDVRGPIGKVREALRTKAGT